MSVTPAKLMPYRLKRASESLRTSKKYFVMLEDSRIDFRVDFVELGVVKAWAPSVKMSIK